MSAIFTNPYPELTCKHNLEPFKPKQLDRYISTACYRFEQQFFADIFKQLSTATIESMDRLLDDINDLDDEEATELTNDGNIGDQQDVEARRLEQIKLKQLKKNIAGAKLKNVGFEIDKIQRLRMLNLPSSFSLSSRKLKQKYYMRIFAAIPSDIKAYKPQTLYASMAIFCYFRSALLTDDLVDTLIQLIHKMRLFAEISINKNILSEVKCVNGKFDILYTLADTALENPAGIIKDTIYPKVSEETLSNLAKELISNKDTWYQHQVQKKIYSLYSHAHRRVLLMLLEIFVFHTNNPDYQEIVQAIEFIKKNKQIKDKYYVDSKVVPAIGAIPSKRRSMVIEALGSR
ncbi:hypothetical protein [Candidatus Tisiphia endosymbiont of Micropterix aruncella]|uniref:hypothetical protein n=1 Tax=Candidatus Tisiphia endosymbiont of Micropterix aruncella TaxID=3066271 RepID=UPI003AA954F7